MYAGFRSTCSYYMDYMEQLYWCIRLLFLATVFPLDLMDFG